MQGVALVMPRTQRRPTPVDIADLVERWGGPMAGGLLEPESRYFRVPDIEGVIGYRVFWRCAVVFGEPVCPPADRLRFADRFRAFCRARGLHAVYVAAGPTFARVALAAGFAAVQFGEELCLDPQRNPQVGAAGRELRKKVQRARGLGVEVHEHQRSMPEAEAAAEADMADAVAEAEMADVVRAWLRGRRGPQIYLTPVRIQTRGRIRRWFVARAGGRAVGVLSLLRLDPAHGFLLEHVVARPDAPRGTTELLIVRALEALGAEGYRSATFGPAPLRRLGHVAGVRPFTERILRAVFLVADRVFHFEQRTRYRRKFQIARAAPSYLLFDAARIGSMDVLDLFRAFHVSLA